jgi:chromosome segregation ATPase
MKEVTPKEKLIINEWKKRQAQHEQAKQELKSALSKYGVASREFNTARVEFEMLKEEFDNFEKENHAVLANYR